MVIIYLVLIFFTYLAGYAYWETKNTDYWLCQAIDGEALASGRGCGIRPDGPLGALLVVVIPFVVTVLFILVALSTYHFQKQKFSKTGKNYNHE